MEWKYDDSGKRRLSFSFGKFITAAVPNFANSATPDSLTSQEMDKLFDFQMILKEPKKLEPASLTLMGCVQEERTGAWVIKKLVDMGVLKNNETEVETRAITKDFANQLSKVPVHSQKRLIVLLFAWEEELMRWRLLEEEEHEIKTVMGEERSTGGENVGHLEKRLLEIDGLKKLKPSLRARRASNVHETLPAYAS
jgi:hypothetical protein